VICPETTIIRRLALKRLDVSDKPRRDEAGQKRQEHGHQTNRSSVIKRWQLYGERYFDAFDLFG
jgi:hypothetical protein